MVLIIHLRRHSGVASTWAVEIYSGASTVRISARRFCFWISSGTMLATAPHTHTHTSDNKEQIKTNAINPSFGDKSEAMFKNPYVQPI